MSDDPIPPPRARIVNWMLIEGLAERVAEVLAPAELKWVTFKGFDVARRFYSRPENRAMSDLDLLVETERFDEVRRRLLDAGFQPLMPDRRVQLYQQQRGYCWQATFGSIGAVEVHRALWNLPPAAFAARVLEHALPDDLLERGAHTPTAEHALLIASVHAWLSPKTQRERSLEDVSRILLARPGIAAAAAAEAVVLELQLPLCLAAAALEPGIGQTSGASELVACLQAQLRPLESWCLRHLRRAGPAAISSEHVHLARLASARRSRFGAGQLPRLLWPHPGVVAMRTPSTWPWWRRRLTVQTERARRLLWKDS